MNICSILPPRLLASRRRRASATSPSRALAPPGPAETADSPLAPKQPHFPARAKRVIFLCMEGGPSHVDTFDYKPKLANRRRDSRSARARFASGKLLASPWKFKQHGQSGLWISELFPELARQADELCLLHSMHTDVPTHRRRSCRCTPASSSSPRPRMGAWIALRPGHREREPARLRHHQPAVANGGAGELRQRVPAGDLPGHAASAAAGQPVAERRSISNLANPNRSPHRAARAARLHPVAQPRAPGARAGQPGDRGRHRVVRAGLPHAGRAAEGDGPRRRDRAATKTLYGIGEPTTDDFGRQCLLARRFVEAGVRFVEVTHGGWDHHRNLKDDHAKNAADRRQADRRPARRPEARGLLEGHAGDLGRRVRPHAVRAGRRRPRPQPQGLTPSGWPAAASRAATRYGETDDYGYEAVEDKVHIHDWHATILHLLGLDHEKLTYRYAGRDMRLTDVKGNVVKEILA